MSVWDYLQQLVNDGQAMQARGGSELQSIAAGVKVIDEGSVARY